MNQTNNSLAYQKHQTMFDRMLNQIDKKVNPSMYGFNLIEHQPIVPIEHAIELQETVDLDKGGNLSLHEVQTQILTQLTSLSNTWMSKLNKSFKEGFKKVDQDLTYEVEMQEFFSLSNYFIQWYRCQIVFKKYSYNWYLTQEEFKNTPLIHFVEGSTVEKKFLWFTKKKIKKISLADMVDQGVQFIERFINLHREEIDTLIDDHKKFSSYSNKMKDRREFEIKAKKSETSIDNIKWDQKNSYKKLLDRYKKVVKFEDTQNFNTQDFSSQGFNSSQGFSHNTMTTHMTDDSLDQLNIKNKQIQVNQINNNAYITKNNPHLEIDIEKKATKNSVSTLSSPKINHRISQIQSQNMSQVRSKQMNDLEKISINELNLNYFTNRNKNTPKSKKLFHKSINDYIKHSLNNSMKSTRQNQFNINSEHEVSLEKYRVNEKMNRLNFSADDIEESVDESEEPTKNSDSHMKFFYKMEEKFGELPELERKQRVNLRLRSKIW